MKNADRPQNKNLKPPFKKGHAPLGGEGRPKGFKPWSAIIREEFENGKISQEEIVKKHLEKAKDGDSKAWETIMERTDGRPIQPIALQGELKTISEADEATLNGELERINSRLAKVEKGDNPGKD